AVRNKRNQMMSLETVVITGASGQVGLALLSVLQGKARTVALVRKHADVPASEVVTDWMRSPTARQMISCAGSIVDLAGNLKPEAGDYKAGNEATTEVLCSTLRSGTSARIIFLSFVAGPTSSPPGAGRTDLASNGVGQRSVHAPGRRLRDR